MAPPGGASTRSGRVVKPKTHFEINYAQPQLMRAEDKAKEAAARRHAAEERHHPRMVGLAVGSAAASLLGCACMQLPLVCKCRALSAVCPYVSLPQEVDALADAHLLGINSPTHVHSESMYAPVQMLSW